MLSVSSFDVESFVSAEDTVADLRDFEDLNEILQTEVDGGHSLYVNALKHLEKSGIPYRSIRCRKILYFPPNDQIVHRIKI